MCVIMKNFSQLSDPHERVILDRGFNAVFLTFMTSLGLIPCAFPPLAENDVVMQSTYFIYSRSGNVISTNICSLLTLKTRLFFLFLRVIFLSADLNIGLISDLSQMSSEDTDLSFYINF